MNTPTDPIEKAVAEFREHYPLQQYSEANPDQAIFISPTLQRKHRDLLETWLRTTLFTLTATAKEEERGRCLREDIRDLQKVLDEPHVSPEWRVHELQAIVYLKGRELMEMDSTQEPQIKPTEVIMMDAIAPFLNAHPELAEYRELAMKVLVSFVKEAPLPR